jgi:type II secretory pathway component GspD/PulD (secretin)
MSTLEFSSTVDPVTGKTVYTASRLPDPVGLATGGLITAITHGSFDRVPLLLQAFGSDEKANLLTTPFAITNDNEEAVFSVSDQFPFQVSSSTTASTFSGFQNAEAKTELSILPRISSENTLTLDIQLDISSFTASPPQAGAPPPANTRSYQGIVTVPNRRYVVFGGLDSQQETPSSIKVPFLGDIPFLGYLFKKSSMKKIKTRIYIFIRPIIFTDEDFSDMKKASRYLHEKIRAESLFGKKSRPIVPDVVLDSEQASLNRYMYDLFGSGEGDLFPSRRK